MFLIAAKYLPPCKQKTIYWCAIKSLHNQTITMSKRPFSGPPPKVFKTISINIERLSDSNEELLAELWYGTRHETPTELPKLPHFPVRKKTKSKYYQSSKILVKDNLKLKQTNELRQLCCHKVISIPNSIYIY